MRKRQPCYLLLPQKGALGAETLLPVVGAFVGMACEFFDETLKASPFVRWQGEELETDAPVPAPAYDGLLNGQRRFRIRHMDTERQRGARMNSCVTDDSAASQGEIDHCAFPLDAIH